jgi:hypothetical protein
MNNRLPARPTQLVIALAAALPALALAAPPDTSAYKTDKQNSYVQDSTSQGVDQVNMITCIVTSMRPDALVNQGDYLALVDKNKCDPKARSSTSNAGSTSDAGSAASYMTAVVNSARASNSDPMRVKAWIDDKEEDHSATIFANVSVTDAPSDSNPYGVFRLDYCGVVPGLSGCMMQGYLQGATDGITYFEVDQGGGGGGQTSALRLQATSTTSGAGAMHLSDGQTNLDFTFAYNADYFLRHTAGQGDQCFSRDATDTDTGMSVWRYGLYDATSGDRINRNGNFPLDYTDANGKVFHGNMGYYGLWMPPDANIANGATVQRVQYNEGADPTKTNYTLVEAPGRLMKYTKRTRTLAAIDKIHFQSWVGDATNFFAGAQSNQQYEMFWDDAAGAFQVTGTTVCSNGPCQSSAFDTPKTVAPSFFLNMGGVHGWSDALGGELFIPLSSGSVNSSTVNVLYRTQDLVYPADIPSTLYCVNNCPTAASMASYFAQSSTDPSPYANNTFNNWMPTTAGGVVSYTGDTSSGLLKDGTGSSVTFTDKNALQQRPQYMNGVTSGRLFTNLNAAQCADNSGRYCDYQVEQMDVYYQWQTGPNNWNQFAALKDAQGNFVAFDPPLQVNYNVPAGAAYGQYAGKSIVLQYAGFGDLWGIPGHCVSLNDNQTVSCDTPQARYVPAFSIPMDDVLGRVDAGGTPMLAKWLDREIRFARKDVSVCTGAGITLPTGLTLPTASGLANPADANSAVYIGTEPTVTAAPRVIQGTVEY